MKKCCDCKKDRDILLFSKNINNIDNLSSQCKVCKKEYYKQNKIRINELRKISRDKNPEKYKQQSNSNHSKHRDERLLKQKLYYLNNIEYFKIKNKVYRENNRDSILLRNRKRRNSLKFSIITQCQINNLLNIHNNKCLYCAIDVKRGINLHLDHKIPLSRGGDHAIYNLAPACKSCNLQKGSSTHEEFLFKNEMRLIIK